MPGIIISLNPAVDVEWRLPEVIPEEKNELESETRWPGGKGVNVARWLRWLGKPQKLFLPLGGLTGRELATGLRAEGLRYSRFPLTQANRANVVVTPARGPQFRFNASWPRLDRSEALRLRRAACQLARLSDPVIISGTLAFGVSSDTYAAIVRAARRSGRKVFLDCDREPFALAAREEPFLVKPNEFELAQWSGGKVSGDRAVLNAARKLSELTRNWVLVSRGADGALLVHAGQHVVFTARVPSLLVRNTVGAGDALLAGVVAAVEHGLPPEEWLRQGVATGTAATQLSPGKLPARSLWRELKRQVEVV